jgi:hypothetical protein
MLYSHTLCARFGRFCVLVAACLLATVLPSEGQTLVPNTLSLSVAGTTVQPGEQVNIAGSVLSGTDSTGAATDVTGVASTLMYDPTVFEPVGSGWTAPGSNPFPVPIKNADTSFTMNGQTYTAIVYDDTTFSPAPLTSPTLFVTFNLEVLPGIASLPESTSVYYSTDVFTSTELLTATNITNGVGRGALPTLVSTTASPDPGVRFVPGILNFTVITPAPSGALVFLLGGIPAVAVMRVRSDAGGSAARKKGGRR